MDYRNEFYHDGSFWELGSALEDKYGKEDSILLRKLEDRLTHVLDSEQRGLFIHFVDASRRHLLRQKGNCYAKGFIMGTEAGKIPAAHEHEE